MALETVTGSLSNFGLTSISGLQPEIEFRPNSPAVGSGGRLMATAPIWVTPDGAGNFTVGLHTTDDLLPSNVYYNIIIHWLDSKGRKVKADNPNWKLQVPAGGGGIADLIRLPIRSGLVIYSPTEPPVWVGVLATWFQLDPNDANNPSNPANTGDIYELRDI